MRYLILRKEIGESLEKLNVDVYTDWEGMVDGTLLERVLRKRMIKLLGGEKAFAEYGELTWLMFLHMVYETADCTDGVEIMDDHSKEDGQLAARFVLRHALHHGTL